MILLKLLKKCITLSIILFVIGVLGIVFNRKSILATLMAIEIMLLAVNLNLIAASMILNSFYGQIFSLFVITVAAAESAIGLAILVVYAKTRGNISIDEMCLLKA
jgi:NADH-quinone oxidoreductase subunit K